MIARFFRRLTAAMMALMMTALLLLSLPAAAKENSLYEDLGGQRGVSALIDQFLWNLADDERINHFFVETNLGRFRDKLNEYFCQVADGPCSYSGDTMLRTHANLGITVADFNVVVECLIHAMESEGVKTGVQNRLLKVLATAFGDVVQH